MGDACAPIDTLCVYLLCGHTLRNVAQWAEIWYYTGAISQFMQISRDSPTIRETEIGIIFGRVSDVSVGGGGKEGKKAIYCPA